MLRHPLLAFLLLTLMTACGSEAVNSEDTADTMSGHHPEHHHPEPPPTETPADTKPSAPNTPNAPGTPDETAPPSEQSANTTPNDLAPLDAMHVGDEFSIKLRSNSGTGYSWQLA
ncbi:MAG: protease inhibitor I42 family protein, partial [Myxococcota bacterium]|nr:protease inhibitor I42 family protein [Myxococcota bacterium]